MNKDDNKECVVGELVFAICTKVGKRSNGYNSTCVHSNRARLRVCARSHGTCTLQRRGRPRFTSMQVNKNVVTMLHIDNNNLGPSLIVAFGEHNRGELYVHNVGKVSVRNTRYIFDGNVPHLIK